MSTITPLPTPPSRNDPANFPARGDAFMSALPTFATETNLVAGEVNTNATNAATSASNSSISATNSSNFAIASAASAASALNAPGTSATSTSSLIIGTGSKAFNLTQTGKAFALGQQVSIAQTSSPLNRMFGVITAFNSGTGAITVLVSSFEGSGTISDWTIALGSAIIPLPPELKQRSIVTADTALVTDRQKVLVFAGGSAATLAFTASSTLTDGWFTTVQNSSAFAWILDPNASELIDGLSTITLQPGEVRKVYCSGTALFSLKLYDDNVLIVRDEKTSGTAGGNATATTWMARNLNTVAVNTIAGAFVASNKVILPPGTYDFDGSCPISDNVGKHKARLYDETAAAVIWLGTSEQTFQTSRSFLKGRITLAVASTLRIDHYTTTTQASTGLGAPTSIASVAEVYTEITFRKVG